MSERVPGKRERRQLFRVAQTTAELLLELKESSRPKGRRGGPDTISFTAFAERQEGIKELIGRFHWALPHVVVELVKPEVQEQIYTYSQEPLDLTPVSDNMGSIADFNVLPIMATGLNRFVRRKYDDKELYAGPDFDANRTYDRYFLNYCPLEVSKDYNEWLRAEWTPDAS